MVFICGTLLGMHFCAILGGGGFHHNIILGFAPWIT